MESSLYRQKHLHLKLEDSDLIQQFTFHKSCSAKLLRTLFVYFSHNLSVE